MTTLTLTSLAEYMMFGIIKTRTELEQRIEGQWQYRKGKDFQDVKDAMRKGIKAGDYKTEREVEWFALYLKDVFKQVKVKKDANAK